MMSARHIFQTLLGSMLVLVPPGSARAEEPREVWVQLSDCSPRPYDTAQLSSFLALELSPYRLQAHVDESAPAGDTDIRLLLSSCDGADSLLLRWETPGEPTRTRVVSLRDVPWPARARALALLISDVLRPPRWAEDETSPTVELPRAATRGASSLAPMTADPLYDLGLPQRSDPYSHPFSAYVTSGLQASWVPRVGLLLYGVGLGVQAGWSHSFEWAIEGSYSGGRGNVSGEIFDLDWWSAGLGVDYNLVAGRRLQIGPRLSVAHVTGFAGTPGAEEFGESTALLGGRIRLSPRLKSKGTSLDLLLDASYPLATLGTRVDAAPLPWTTWVVTTGVSVSVGL